MEVNNENRGSTFFTGSDGNWDTCPSVLNFIKQYNPGVIGGATGRTRIVMFPPSMEVSVEIKCQYFMFILSQETGDPGLNLSVSGAVAEDVPGMVKRIISMVQAVPGWQTKWKMISLLIGHNDLCSKSCLTTWQRLGISKRVRVEPRDYERNIRKSDQWSLTSE